MITKERKAELIEQFGKTGSDTGTPEVQIALFSNRISELTEHLKTHPRITPRVVVCSSWLVSAAGS